VHKVRNTGSGTLASISDIIVFAASALAIIPLAELLGETADAMLVEKLSLATAMISSLVSLDGESNWLEGDMPLAVYGILGLAFFFLPLRLYNIFRL